MYNSESVADIFGEFHCDVDVENFAGEVGVTKFDELPFGAYNDPITYVTLAKLHVAWLFSERELTQIGDPEWPWTA